MAFFLNTRSSLSFIYIGQFTNITKNLLKPVLIFFPGCLLLIRVSVAPMNETRSRSSALLTSALVECREGAGSLFGLV